MAIVHGDASDPRNAKSRRRRLELRLVLDTNLLYTGSASDLVQQELSELIHDSQRHTDVVLSWYLPEIVRMERRYQMLQAALALMPSVNKLERLLGSGLAITEDILAGRVDAAIATQIGNLGLRQLSLEHSDVDWPRLIAASANREPPFEPGKYEKGFRDAVLAESFLQLVEKSPRSSATCRIILITGDNLLAKAVGDRLTTAANARILQSLDAVRDLVNTLVSDITEQFVAAIRSAAEVMFFEKANENTLFYIAGVRSALAAKFAAALAELPSGADSLREGTWFIGPPRFVKKVKQRVHWISTVRASKTATKTEQYSGFTIQPSTNLGLGPYTQVSPAIPSAISISTPLFTPSQLPAGGSLWNTFDQPSNFIVPNSYASTRDIDVAKGSTAFEVSWSVTVTARKKLVRPSVDALTVVGTTWDVTGAT